MEFPVQPNPRAVLLGLCRIAKPPRSRFTRHTVAIVMPKNESIPFPFACGKLSFLNPTAFESYTMGDSPVSTEILSRRCCCQSYLARDCKTRR
jgi:hypothetical protein